jgi:hypothetical protein
MIGPSPRRVTVMLGGSAACVPENIRNREQKVRTIFFSLFIVTISIGMGFKRAKNYNLTK